MKKIIILTILVLSLSSCSGQNNPEVCFKDVCIQVEIADTRLERQQGLMFREYLEENQGMLFIFEDEDTHSFWMKDTLIALDMIWINSSYHIVHIEQAAPCKTENCRLYKPPKAARYVLEVNKEFTEENNIKIGDVITTKLY